MNNSQRFGVPKSWSHPGKIINIINLAELSWFINLDFPWFYDFSYIAWRRHWENPRIDDWMRKPTQRVFESVVLHPSCFNCMIPTPWIFQSFQIIAEVAQPTYNVFVFPLPYIATLPFAGNSRLFFLPSNHWNITWEIQVIKDLVQKPSIRQHWDLLQQRNPSTPLGCNHFPPWTRQGTSSAPFSFRTRSEKAALSCVHLGRKVSSFW